MPRFAANITHLWPELPFLERLTAAADAGFEAVEALFPYDVAVPQLTDTLRRLDLRMILINAPPPNYTGGPRGFAAVPGREERFARDIRRSLRFAEALGVDFLHVMAGTAEGDEARQTFVNALRQACELAPEGITITIEPLNQTDMPGYFLSSYDLAAEIIDAVGAPNLALQYDSYHAGIITGDALATFQEFQPYIRHIQIGDTPSRGAPGTGRIDFAALFGAIDASGYSGWVSAEYTPGSRTEDSLGWLRTYGKKSPAT